MKKIFLLCLSTITILSAAQEMYSIKRLSLDPVNYVASGKMSLVTGDDTIDFKMVVKSKRERLKKVDSGYSQKEVAIVMTAQNGNTSISNSTTTTFYDKNFNIIYLQETSEKKGELVKTTCRRFSKDVKFIGFNIPLGYHSDVAHLRCSDKTLRDFSSLLFKQDDGTIIYRVQRYMSRRSLGTGHIDINAETDYLITKKGDILKIKGTVLAENLFHSSFESDDISEK